MVGLGIWQILMELSEKMKDSNLATIPFFGNEVYAEQPELLIKMINQFLT